MKSTIALEEYRHQRRRRLLLPSVSVAKPIDVLSTDVLERVLRQYLEDNKETLLLPMLERLIRERIAELTEISKQEIAALRAED